MQNNDPNSLPVKKKPQILTKGLLGGLILTVTGIIGGGWLAFEWFGDKLTKSTQENLLAIADLKTSQIEQWIMERRGDAQIFADRPVVYLMLNNITKADQNPQVKKQLQMAADLTTKEYRYSRIILLNNSGRMVWTSDQMNDLPSDVSMSFQKSIESKQPELVDLHWHKSNTGKSIAWGIIAPVYNRQIPESPLWGGVYLEINPKQYLFPLIQSWPTSSKTAETFLVRKEGNIIRYLTSVRHEFDSPLNLTRSANNPRLLAVQAMQPANNYLLRGIDYRGVSVIGARRMVKGTNWVMIAKIDSSEADKSLRQLMIAIISLTVLLIAIAISVTENLRRSNHTLHSLSERLELAVKSAEIGIWEWDIISDRLIWDTRMYEIYGVDPTEFLANYQAWENTIVPEDRPLFNHARELALKGEKDYDCDFRIIHPKGKIHYIKANAIVQFNSEDQPERMIGINCDITQQQSALSERQQAETALKESEIRFRRIFESSVVGMMFADFQGRITGANDRLLQIIGYSREELNAGVIRWDTMTPPEYAPKDVAIIEHIKEHGFIEPWQKEYYRKDGSRVPVLIGVALLPETPDQCICVVVDISEQQKALQERKQIEIELIKSRDLKEVIYNESADALFLVDTDTLLNVDCNNRAVEMFEVDSKEELMGIEGRTLQKRQFTDEEIISIEDDVDKQGFWVREIQYTSKKGRDFWGNLAVKRIHVLGKSLNLVRVTDISDRKQAENQLRQSEAHLAEAQRIAKIGSWAFDLDRQKVTWSEEVFRIFGQDPKLYEPTYEKLEQSIHPEDLSRHNTTVQMAIETGKTHEIEFRFFRPDHTMGWLWSKIQPVFSETDQVIGLMGVVLEITERKQSEEQLRNLSTRLELAIKSAQIGIWEWDIVNERHIWDERMCELYGFNYKDCVATYQLWEKAIHPEDRDFANNAIRQALRGEKDYDPEFRIIRTDGKIRSIKANAFVQRNAEGKPLKMIGINYDITEQKAALLKRQQVEAELEKLNQELEQRILERTIALQKSEANLQDRLNELKQRNAEMILLSGISDFLQSCLTVEEACTTIGSLSKPLFPECSGAIFIIAHSRDHLEMITSWGNQLSSASVFYPQDCWALRRGRVHWVARGLHQLFCNHIDHENAPTETLCIPMIAQGETIGLLYLSASQPNLLSENRQQLARTVAEQVSMAIANINLRETLQNQSIRDPLTGLFNRRYLEEFLAKEIFRAQRNEYSVGIIMIDIDHFKKFNDNLGHDAGDFVLQEISKLLKNMIRSSDVACRYGGEEITLIFSEVSLEETSEKAEQIRVAIAQQKLHYNGKIMDVVTASLGVASYPDHGLTGNAVIQAADAALYRAKAAGRNQVIIAGK
jgi:diguanylate cyclase (GGDEF)-like protein/PAS domain S-box-containing protein